MGLKKIEIKYIQDRITRQVTFSKRRIGMFKKADALAKLSNVEVAVLLISPSTGRPYVFGSPCFNSVVGRFQYPYLKRTEKSSFSPKQIRILKSQSKLDRLMEELKQHKEREKGLKKRKEEILEKYDIKKIVDLKLEELTAFKEKLEAFRDDMKRKHMEMEASSSLLILSKTNSEETKKNI